MEPTEFTITIKGNEKGIVTAHDSRTGETEEWAGVGILLGSVNENKFAPFFWGEYSSITYALYASIVRAKHEEGPVGEHHRNILGRICRMVVELCGFFRRAGNLSIQEALDKWEKEDKAAQETTTH